MELAIAGVPCEETKLLKALTVLLPLEFESSSLPNASMRDVAQLDFSFHSQIRIALVFLYYLIATTNADYLKEFFGNYGYVCFLAN
jgi:hypothetical protein